jgi:hypothetical protein
MRPYRLLFALAALYNGAFGVWAGLFPFSFFQLFQLEPPHYPSIWACLGLSIGLYGLAYAHLARRPERGDVLVAIGLLGNVLAPLIWLGGVARDELPPSTFPLILVSCLIWWFPFLAYLLRHSPARRRVIAWVAAAVHALACMALMGCAVGTEVGDNLALRLSWLQHHQLAWVATWTCWVLASLSFVAFTTTWAAHLRERGASSLATAAGLLTVVLGLPFDLVGESINAIWPMQPLLTHLEFTRGGHLYAVLSAGTANGLYRLGGLILSLISWRMGWMRGWLGVLGFAAWIVGLALTAMVLLDSGRGMIATGAGLMILFIPWAVLVGWRMREPHLPPGLADSPPKMQT